jgi:hypothetical protein
MNILRVCSTTTEERPCRHHLERPRPEGSPPPGPAHAPWRLLSALWMLLNSFACAHSSLDLTRLEDQIVRFVKNAYPFDRELTPGSGPQECIEHRPDAIKSDSASCRESSLLLSLRPQLAHFAIAVSYAHACSRCAQTPWLTNAPDQCSHG